MSLDPNIEQPRLARRFSPSHSGDSVPSIDPPVSRSGTPVPAPVSVSVSVSSRVRMFDFLLGVTSTSLMAVILLSHSLHLTVIDAYPLTRFHTQEAINMYCTSKYVDACMRVCMNMYEFVQSIPKAEECVDGWIACCLQSCMWMFAKEGTTDHTTSHRIAATRVCGVDGNNFLG